MVRPTKEITIYQIAKEAGVSVPTVSRVINRGPGVAEKTRKKVRRLLSEYDYKPEYPTVSTAKIAITFEGKGVHTEINSGAMSFSDYRNRVLRAVYANSAHYGMLSIIIPVKCQRRETLLEIIRGQQCCGVLAFGAMHYRQELESVRGTDLPVIALDTSWDCGENIGYVDNDSYSGSVAATKHLLELGHKRIGYLSYFESEKGFDQFQRFKGYENTMRVHGIEIPPSWKIRLPEELSPPQEGGCGYNAMKLLLESAPEITAVMAVDDEMALGALRAIHEAGLRVPEDISIVGFDNCPRTLYSYPPLTTVNHPVEEECNLAFELILQDLGSPGTWSPLREIMPTELVVRDSTGPAKG